MIWEQELYVTCGSLTMTTGWRRRSTWWSSRWRRWPSAQDRWRGKRAVVKNLMKRASSHEDHFPKTLFALSWCRIAEDDSSGDLFFRSQIHVDEWDEVASVVQLQKWRNLDVLVFCDCWYVAISVAAAHIYREDPPRVTASRNRLGLSLSKCIRHRLVVKINDKRRSWACEALGRISVDYSRARHAPTPIASAHPTQRGEVSERTCVFLPFSSPPHTCKCIESNPPYK
jgi:predicted deacetylase